jgi:probable rRNA maturation factor
MITDSEPPAGAESGVSGEDEPSRTCTDLTIGDERWDCVAGLQDLISKLALETLREVQLSPSSHCVSVALLSGAEVRSLNKAFRGVDSPTNVLSFPSPSAARALGRKDEPVFLGDVALSYETVESEASAQDKTMLQHAAHLVVHGILHLAGFDHGGDADAECMEAAERNILAKFDIPDPYGEAALANAH